MKHLLILLICSSCAAPEVHQVYVKDNEEWLTTAANLAFQFWADEPRGISFEFATETKANLIIVQVEDLGPDAAATYSFYQVKVEQRVSGWSKIDQKCIIAHELGHYLGLDHVEGKVSLMNAQLGKEDFGCNWSELDQEQFCQTNDCTLVPRT